MKNINDAITTKYYQLLTAAVDPVPVFRDGYVPFDLATDAYVMVSAVSNTDASTFYTADTNTSIQVGIYSRSSNDNNSTVVNDIAETVYQTIKPTFYSTIQVPGFDVLTTELDNDTSPAPIDTGSQLFINRFITFNHKIVHL